MRIGRLILLMLMGACVAAANAQVPQTMNYQGLLTDASGSPVADGNYSLTFRIYDAASGGTQLWTESQSSVAVSGGLFKARLGSVTPLTVDFDDAYWLEIQVGAESPQVPRIELTSTPYTFMAMDIEDDAVTSAKIMDGEVATADIQDDAVTAAKIAPNVVSSVDGVINDGGDIDLVAGANVTITPNDGANTITIEASGGGGGDITGVSAGQGLTGGGTSGDVYLDVGAGTGIAVSTDAVGLASSYADGSAHDSRFVNEGQSNSITSAMIVDGTIQQGDLGFSAGDVTAVWSGDGLDGGGDQGDLTLSIENPLVVNGWANDGVIQAHNGSSGHSALMAPAGGAVFGLGGGGTWGYLGGNYGAYGDDGGGTFGSLGGSPGGTRGAYGESSSGTWGYLGGIRGVYGHNPGGDAAYFNGDVYVNGSINKAACSFVIDHPLDPAGKLLRHTCVESPEYLVMYRGTARLDSRGEALVRMPEYFGALAAEDGATVTLTPVGRPFLVGYEWNAGQASFTAYGEPDRECSWVVYADRDDPVVREVRRPVEEQKGPDNPTCDRGRLLRPSAYGYPETASATYEEEMHMLTGSGRQERPERVSMPTGTVGTDGTLR
jgi:hypothetical protein